MGGPLLGLTRVRSSPIFFTCSARILPRLQGPVLERSTVIQREAQSWVFQLQAIEPKSQAFVLTVDDYFCNSSEGSSRLKAPDMRSARSGCKRATGAGQPKPTATLTGQDEEKG